MANMHRVAQVSRVMKLCCTLGIIGIPLFYAAWWAIFNLWAPLDPDFADIAPERFPLPLGTLVVGFLITMLPGGIAMFAVWRLRALFGLYARGLVFTAANARCLRDYAIALMASAVANPIAKSLLWVALTYGNPPEAERIVTFGFGSSEIKTLFLGFVFLVIAWVMDAGRELAEDQAQIV